MVKPRVVETTDGIQGEYNVQIFDAMARRMRDKGWTEVGSIIKSGLDHDLALEYGCGPGYIGLEWLMKTQNTKLKAVDISPEMIKLAQKNAAEYGLQSRVEYALNDGKNIPFPENTFDAVFTTSSFHEWQDPIVILSEFFRILKPGGKAFVSDLRRDMSPLIKWFIYAVTKPKEIRPGLLTSLAAAYTVTEAEEIFKKTPFRNFSAQPNPFGLNIIAVK